ncbi:Der1-like family-domain-containing protein [Geopyxis carbonaria]|nr:Der1-like family-domain-containing protein [Geopyxis carbonaria]
MADLATLYREAPPVARTLALGAATLSFASLAANLIDPMHLIYYSPAVFNTRRPEVWRLVTSFLLTGPQLSILLDPFFLYKYASDCEKNRFARTGDFIMFLLFTGTGILTLNTYLTGGMTFCSPLILALAYYWTAFEAPGGRVSFFIATFPVKFLPWGMLLMSFVQGGPTALMNNLTGLVSAHAYLFLTTIWPTYGGGSNILATPQWLHTLCEGAAPPPPPRAAARAPPRRSSVAPQPVSVDTPGSSSSSTTTATTSGRSMFGRASDAWSHRGQGHRLGS